MSSKFYYLHTTIFFLAFIMNGCSIMYYGKTPAPEEAYWGKDGFNLQQTAQFMKNVCGLKRYGNMEIFNKETPIFERCMLDNGFVYMTDFHKITRHGYQPLSQGFCKESSSFYNYPACKSYRGEPYK
jgi:hypothetical protein